MRTVVGRKWAEGLFLCIFLAASAGAASAGTTTVASGSAPVIIAQMRAGTLTVRTWNRPQVQIATDGSVTARNIAPQQVARRIPKQIPLGTPQLLTPRGPIGLPPEPFVVPRLAPGPHAGVVLRGSGNTVVTIPATSALLIAHLMRGSMTISGYRGGVFLAVVRVGNVRLLNVAGTGAVQVLSGRIIALHSDFTRLQARTARGNLLFRNCTATQIEATSVLGSIAYDNGTFRPGLARFQSERGNVALGLASGGLQIGAHSNSGQIYSALPSSATVRRSANTAQATVGGGGPVVTANSGTGSVFLYQGALRSHPQLRQRLQKLRAQQQRSIIRRPPPVRRAPPRFAHHPPIRKL
ncbi:MAG TPA: hypothetical protein VNF68_02760 [Candidatus Baltobacteraceae bacterium]|nr:hypothetical protein [Candidatus Baltobacteraceae bacterium]